MSTVPVAGSHKVNILTDDAYTDECLTYLASRGVNVPNCYGVEFHDRRAWVNDRSAPIENTAAVVRLLNLAGYLAGKCPLRGQYRRGEALMRYEGVEQFECAERLARINVYGNLNAIDILPDGIRGKLSGKEATYDDPHGCRQVFATEAIATRLESN